jgi:uncharacterized membrane protein
LSLRRVLNWLVGLPIALIVIAFAIANRQWVTVSLDPISRENPFAAVSMPLWALLFFGAFLGLLAGWIACWFSQGKWRRSTRESRLELSRAQAEAAQLRRELEARQNLPETRGSIG